jgi:hypothetical protein
METRTGLANRLGQVLCIYRQALEGIKVDSFKGDGRISCLSGNSSS